MEPIDPFAVIAALLCSVMATGFIAMLLDVMEGPTEKAQSGRARWRCKKHNNRLEPCEVCAKERRDG